MGNSADFLGGFLLGGLLASVLVGVITADYKNDVYKKLQTSAVEAKVAEWVVSDAKGNTEFRWKKPSEVEEKKTAKKEGE